MPPKKSSETGPNPNQDQGLLFEEVVTTRGAIDLDDVKKTVNYDVGEGDGVFPEVTDTPDPTTVELATNAATKAIAGKHSPLQRSGTYRDVKVGDFLPNFGPVTTSNFDRAREHAKGLEKQRLKKN